MSDTTSVLPRVIDAAVLKPHLSREEADEQIRQMIELSVYSVCVRPWDLPSAVVLCRGSQTLASTVIGFPHGTQTADTKLLEATAAIAAGARELDMVVNYGMLRSGMLTGIQQEIARLVLVCRPANVPLKVIFETSQLSVDEIRSATECAVAAGATFIKSSTGFTGEGATPEVIHTMVEAADGRIQVKASGGIRDAETAEHYLSMGVTRLGVGAGSVRDICTGGQVSGDVY
ncbi:MAG: deoxyribose-phosphate aldolase [Spirochaetaceae bacterium]|nr:MAG: deoxyribose-phosphate aldolase [Spirochaetaceae bacterium]